MDIAKRMLTLRVLEKMADLPEYARKLGLADRSAFRPSPAAETFKPVITPGESPREKS